MNTQEELDARKEENAKPAFRELTDEELQQVVGGMPLGLNVFGSAAECLFKKLK